MEYNRHVVSVKSQEPNSLIVTDLHGEGTDFQAVVLTMPVPQILQLEGTVQKALGESVVNTLISLCIADI